MDFTSYQVIDYETTKLRPYDGARIFSYCICHCDGTVERCRLDHKDKELNRRNRQRLILFWNDTSIKKIMHNAKYELAINDVAGIAVPEGTELHDTMLISQLFRNLAPAHGLAWLDWELRDPQRYHFGGKEFGSRELDKFIKAEGKRLGSYQYIDHKLMDIYQIADGQRTMLLFLLWYEELLSDQALYADYRNEIDLVVATQRMEAHGLNIDPEACLSLIKWLEIEIDKIQHDTYKLLGRFMNLGSPKQLIRLLYGELGFPIYAFTKSKQPATDKDTILQLREEFAAHEKKPILDLILKHRSYTDGLANIKSYLNFANEKNILHHSILTNRARTGRQSAVDPNLQNVGKGRESDRIIYPVPARSCFVCREGCINYYPDYSGIELRLIIEASGCVKMMDYLRKGIHPHIVFCELMFGDKWKGKDDSRALYDLGKNGHFCLCYGGSRIKLASTMGLSLEEVIPGVTVYGLEYPEIRYLVRDGLHKVQGIGYVLTPFGRKLWLDPDKFYGWLNYYIQGTAAGILKRAQVRIQQYLDTYWKGCGIQVILPIHDELVISFPRSMLKYKDQILSDITRIMIYMPEINVPLEVEWKRTTWAWDKAKEIVVPSLPFIKGNVCSLIRKYV